MILRFYSPFQIESALLNFCEAWKSTVDAWFIMVIIELILTFKINIKLFHTIAFDNIFGGLEWFVVKQWYPTRLGLSISGRSSDRLLIQLSPMRVKMEVSVQTL